MGAKVAEAKKAELYTTFHNARGKRYQVVVFLLTLSPSQNAAVTRIYFCLLSLSLSLSALQL